MVVGRERVWETGSAGKLCNHGIVEGMDRGVWVVGAVCQSGSSRNWVSAGVGARSAGDCEGV